MGWTNEHLTTACKFVSAVTIAAGASANTDVEGTAVDMSGFQGIVAVVLTGPITAGAVMHINLVQSDSSNMGTPSDLTGTKQVVSDGSDNTMFIIDALRPAKRYVQLHVDRGTQVGTVAAHYILYGATKKPVTQPTEVTGVERFKDVVGGTA